MGSLLESIVSIPSTSLPTIHKTAKRKELAEANPAEGAERLTIPGSGGAFLEPAEVARTRAAFTDEHDGTAFLTLVLTGVRRGELQSLRVGDVDITNLDGARLRVRDSKTDNGVRSIALSESPCQHRRRTSFQGDDERVSCNPKTGRVYRPETLRAALVRRWRPQVGQAVP